MRTYITEGYRVDVVTDHTAKVYNRANEYLCTVEGYMFDGIFTAEVVKKSSHCGAETIGWIMEAMPLMEAILG